MELGIVNNYREKLLNILRMNPSFKSARGEWLYDMDGKRYYDALSQYGVQIFGHNNAELSVKAVKYLNGHNTNFIQPFFSQSTKKLTTKLKAAFNNYFHHVCFANSGAEAVEASLKLARLKTGKPRVVSLTDGFHGKTFSALSACGSDRYKAKEICDDSNHISIQIGDIESFVSLAKSDDVAAFIFEPIQGEGGMKVVSHQFIKEIISICKANNIIVIADEVQCGLGRCKSISYSLDHAFEVDMVLLGKGLGGGIVPISALLYTKKIYNKAFEKKHSSTFSGGGFACSIAANVIDMLTRDSIILNSIKKLSDSVDLHACHLNEKYCGKVCVTGEGLMRGISFSEKHGSANYFTLFIHNSGMLSYIICSYLMSRYAIQTMPLMSHPCAIRFEPALNTSEVHVGKFFKAIDDVANLMKHGRYDILMGHLIGLENYDYSENLEYVAAENSDFPIIESIHSTDPDYKDFDFAFLIHPTSEKDIIKIMPRAMHIYLNQQQQLELAHVLINGGLIDPSPDIALAFRIHNGSTSRKGLLIFSPLMPKDMMRLPPRDKIQLLDEYFKCARSMGAKVVGLGAYTSVISRAGLDIANRYPDMHITTGNSLTAISTYEQFKSVYRSSEPSTAAIIGARGSVGRVVTLHVVRDVPKIILVGKSDTNIFAYKDFIIGVIKDVLADSYPVKSNSVAGVIKSLFQSVNNTANNIDAGYELIVAELCSETIESNKPIIVSANVESSLRQSQYVISCTSEGKPFLDDRHLPEGAVAFDAGRPFDFLVCRSGKAKVYEAGLIKQPHSFYYGDCNLVIDKPGVNLACFSETIILALEGAARHYSIGRNIDVNDINEIKAMAERNNYVPCLVDAG